MPALYTLTRWRHVDPLEAFSVDHVKVEHSASAAGWVNQPKLLATIVSGAQKHGGANVGAKRAKTVDSWWCGLVRLSNETVARYSNLPQQVNS